MMRRLVMAVVLLSVMGGLATTSAEVTFKFSGDVLYRWSLDWNHYRNVDGDDSLRTGDFQNRYWWNLRMSATVNENLSINARLSNPSGYFTDRVGSNLNLALTGTSYNFVAIPELYFKWNWTVLTLMGGFIPVAGPGPNMYNSVLDLVAFETGKYVNAGIMPWFVATNGSQAGVDLAVQFVKMENFTAGIDVMGTIAADSGASETVDQIRKDQYRVVVGLPMSILKGKIGVQPNLHVRTNVARSNDLKKGNASLTGGGDLIVKPLKDPTKLVGRVGFAAGGYRNSSRKDDSGYVASAPLGLLFNAGVKGMPGFGTASVDFSIGNWMDREQNPDVVKNRVLYWDFIYDLPVKSLTIRPRLRLWKWSNNAEDNDWSRLLARPELDFIAKF